MARRQARQWHLAGVDTIKPDKPVQLCGSALA
jgi:hypothetical protein